MLGKQPKAMTEAQIKTLDSYLATTRHPIRNQLIVSLSSRAGLRAKEIAELTWSMVTDPQGAITDTIRLPDTAAKGGGGGVIPMAGRVRLLLQLHYRNEPPGNGAHRIIRTDRAEATTAQVIVNMFGEWFRALGYEGCSSHSGRRTFITRAARNIGVYGGSLRDVQALARHRSLAMTQRYIEIDTEAMRKVVDA
jgi:integrase/recombinase XerD